MNIFPEKIEKITYSFVNVPTPKRIFTKEYQTKYWLEKNFHICVNEFVNA